MLSKEELHAAFVRKLKASALSLADSKQLGFQPFTADQLEQHARLSKDLPLHAAGFTLPYYDVAGADTDFYRYRYLEQPTKNGFAGLTVQKEVRYTQPANLPPQVYFPALFDWPGWFTSDKRYLLATEGELKAACAVKFGFPCIALGGVWNFKSGSTLLIPDLAALPLEELDVYIVYDSDAVTNPQVLMAENAFARQLLKADARPYVLRLPALKKGAKTGLDDYLVAKGQKAFQKLVDSSEEWAPSAALHELNEEVLFLNEPAEVLQLATRNRWRSATFVSAAYANRKYSVTEYRGKEGKAAQVEKSASAEWIKWEGRAQVERVTYRPGEPTIVDNEYNNWRGWGLKAPVKGDIKPWRQFLDYIFLDCPREHKLWFEQWLAYPLQHPGTKLFQAVVMWGRAGTGKTLIAHTMARIYGENYTEVNERELHGGFNEWAEAKQFAFGDEITGGDKRGVADWLKGLITQKFLRVNPKYVRSYVVPDCMNWYFASNHPDAFFLDDDDRRYLVQEIKGEPLPRDFYRNYDQWYRSEAGASALWYHLLHIDVGSFDPHGPAPVTQAKRDMIEDGRSDLGAWCASLRDTPDQALCLAGGHPIPRHLWTTSELYALKFAGSRVTPNGLARELKRAGFRKALNGTSIKVKDGVQRLWVIRPIKAVKPTDYARIYDDELGSLPTEKKEKY